MRELDVLLMPGWQRRLLGVKYEGFDSYVSIFSVKFDQIPNPTREETTISKLPVKAIRYTATHWPGRLVLRSIFKNNHGGPAGLTKKGSCLEIFSFTLPEELK